MFLSDGSPTLIGRKQQISARREPDSVKSAAATIRTPFANLHAKPRAQITPRSPRAPFFHPRPPLLQLQGLLTTFGGFRGGGRGDIGMARGGGEGLSLQSQTQELRRHCLGDRSFRGAGLPAATHGTESSLSRSRGGRLASPAPPGSALRPGTGRAPGLPGQPGNPGRGGGSGGAGAPGSRL